jgi:hypothetical protein
MEKSDSTLGHLEHHREENDDDSHLLMSQEIYDEANDGTDHEDDIEQIAQFQHLVVICWVGFASGSFF